MQSKNNTKQRNASIQGLRSFKDTLPKNVKKIINKKGHIYSETLSNWKYLVGSELFKICYPKTFKNSNKFGVSTLMVMVKPVLMDIAQGFQKAMWAVHHQLALHPLRAASAALFDVVGHLVRWIL